MCDFCDSQLVWLNSDGQYVHTIKAEDDAKPYILQGGVYTPQEAFNEPTS